VTDERVAAWSVGGMIPKAKIKVLGEELVLLPVCSLQIPHRLAE
jgi:hypothetical protein